MCHAHPIVDAGGEVLHVKNVLDVQQAFCEDAPVLKCRQSPDLQKLLDSVKEVEGQAIPLDFYHASNQRANRRPFSRYFVIDCAARELLSIEAQTFVGRSFCGYRWLDTSLLNWC